jgi:Domain of unknown function (DUF4129)
MDTFLRSRRSTQCIRRPPGAIRMAESLTRAGAIPGAIPVLEEAVHLLRQAPLGTLLWHWVGSVPLVFVLLLFWSHMWRPRAAESATAVESLVLALLLIWMSCCRAVFAGRLRRQLSGAKDAPWTGRRVFGLLAGQSLLGATKLVVMPVACLLTFPLADTVAFYRYAAVWADREDLDPLQLIGQARQLTAVGKAQGWAILPVLFFLQILVALNVTLALALLPQLARILTGYETAFSRSGWFFILNPLFWLLSLAVSWIAFDPFVQAVYTVRCFLAESVKTGEDLRAGIRRIRAAIQVSAIVCLFMVLPARASDAISPKDLERSARQAMQAHEYDWRLPPSVAISRQGPSWIVTAVDRVIAGLRSFFHGAGQVIQRFLKWLFEKFNVGPSPQSGSPPVSGLHWSVYLLTGAAGGAALWFAWRMRRARRARKTGGIPPAATVRLDAPDDDLSPDLLPEEQWLELAARCLQDGNYRLAIRAWYLAHLAWLGRHEFIAIHPGKTNREYERELLRRARSVTGAIQLFAVNMAAFERTWYGMHQVSAADASGFRDRMDQMKALLAQPGVAGA